MPATSLRGLLGTKQDTFVAFGEENLEKGRIYVYTQGANYSRLWCGFCFHPGVAGTATIEVWGAGGSGAKMCCCGFGLPGNSAAYAKRTISLAANGYVCGCTGQSCGNGDTLCHRGCSEPTFMNISKDGTAGGCTCICAQGGAGGVSYCSTNESFYCCYKANGFCITKTENDHCGIVCNMCDGKHIASAYCGNVMCPGRTSCVSAFGCHPSCPCQFTWHNPTPAGMFSEDGAYITYNTENGNGFSEWSGNGGHQLEAALGAGRFPTGGIPWSTCWGASKACNCYEADPCIPHVPIGMGGHGPMPCDGVRDHANRGGHGGVRIKWITA